LRWIDEYRRFWEGSLDGLGMYIRELQSKEKNHDSK